MLWILHIDSKNTKNSQKYEKFTTLNKKFIIITVIIIIISTFWFNRKILLLKPVLYTYADSFYNNYLW